MMMMMMMMVMVMMIMVVMVMTKIKTGNEIRETLCDTTQLFGQTRRCSSGCFCLMFHCDGSGLLSANGKMSF